MMILEFLARLSSMSASMERPLQDRKKRPDTQKNRKAMIQACENSDLPALEALIAEGAPVNFINVVSGHVDIRRRSPLAICASHDWVAGAVALVNAGADEAAIEGFFDKPGQPSCLEVAATAPSVQIFSLLFAMHGEDDRRKAVSRVTDPLLYSTVESLRYADHIPPAVLRRMAQSCLASLSPSLADQPSHAAKAMAFDAIVDKLAAREDPDFREQLWLAALRAGPGPIQGLAKHGIELPLDNKVGIKPSNSINGTDALSSWVKHVHKPVHWDPNRMEHQFTEKGQELIRVGLATAALILSPGYDHVQAAYALCSLEALRDELVQSELGRHFLTRRPDQKILRRLAGTGVDMESIRSDQGDNPLHRLAETGASKTDLEAMARICPSWISQRNAKNQLPLELLDSARQASLAVLFDQIGMRSTGAVRRGARKKPSSSRRL